MPFLSHCSRAGTQQHTTPQSQSPELKPRPRKQSLVVATAQAGGQHTVALSNEGQVYTFGAGQSGRLGHGNDKNQLVPTLVAALEFEEVVSIASGYAHTVVLTGEGEIYTWGSGKMGRLGHGADSDEVLPRRVTVHSHPTIKPVSLSSLCFSLPPFDQVGVLI